MLKLRFIQKLKEIWSIEDLRIRILNTLVYLLIFRLASFIILPGVDFAELKGLQNQTKDGLLSLLNTFAGGAFDKASIVALGIMPYISASIVIQLLTMAVPAFQRLSREGEEGRDKMNQYTRILTIGITLFQAIGYVANLKNGEGNRQALMYLNGGGMGEAMFTITSVGLLVAGTMFAMWIGERITDKGLGNGISLLIMIGIIASFLPSLLGEIGLRFTQGNLLMPIIELAIWVGVIIATILLIQGVRRIPVQYAKRMVGNRLAGGVRQYLPLKINAAGVMPIIFAQALMFIPVTFTLQSAVKGLSSFTDPTSWQYNLVFGLLVVIFTYFYTAITIDSRKISEEMKRNGGFVPGIKPGNKTTEFIDTVMSRITLPGSIFLALVAILPAFAQKLMGVSPSFAQFYGGTSLLIMVGVILDTLQQINSYLQTRHYDGLLKSGKFRGRSVQSGM